MMEYLFYIQTTDGVKTGTVITSTNFSYAPFGAVPYRQESTCELIPDIISEFWSSIDQVLTQHSMSSAQFIRAIRATVGDTVYGESF